MSPRHAKNWAAIVLAAASLVAGCGGGGDSGPTAADDTRAQDSRVFVLAEPNATTFAPLAAAPGDSVDMSTTSRWAGVLNGASYRVEVPPNWNGALVMYAHGYVGTGSVLAVQNPLIRRHLIQNGYAWAASSYSKNYYDARAGVEDTNALALEFTKIAAARSRPLAAPSRFYITGVSMGGHITGAAIDDEAQATAVHKVKYHGAVPMCGVMGDTELFNEFAAMQVTAQVFAGQAAYPTDRFIDIAASVAATLFTNFPSKPTAVGVKYLSVLKNITGGERPMFDLGVALGGSFSSAYASFGSDGTVWGILNKKVVDTNAFTYVIDGDTAGSAALNASAQKLTADPNANPMRADGLRWIPKVNGAFRIPVVSLHTLGDLYVPFRMEQIFNQRVAAQGNSGWLVQRAIRGVSHCDFTVAEMAAAFDDMVRWERSGVQPAGDDVVTPATVAAPTFGCKFTNNTMGPDEAPATRALRQATVANVAPCP